MNFFIIIIEAIVFIGIFSALVIIIAIKHPEYGIHNYPKEIQEEYFKTHKKINTNRFGARTIVLKSFGILIFTIILSAGAILAKAENFLDGFIFSAILFLTVGAWDTFFIDWVLFAHLKIFRLEGTEHMDKEYSQKWFHVKGMIFPGSLFLLIVSFLTGLIIEIIKNI